MGECCVLREEWGAEVCLEEERCVWHDEGGEKERKGDYILRNTLLEGGNTSEEGLT